MTNRNPLECNECGTRIITRTAIGHGDYQEFAFSCPGCGIEIRFGMNLYPREARWEYVKLTNAKWVDSEDGITNEIKLDGESLIPVYDSDVIMPFLKTVFLAKDVNIFTRHQSLRFMAMSNIWPMIEKILHYYEDGNQGLLVKSLKEVGYEASLDNERDFAAALIWVFDRYGVFFRMRKDSDEQTVRQRINLAESIATKGVMDFYMLLKSSGRLDQLFREANAIRKTWATLYSFLFPIFNVYYWDSTNHNLTDYTLCQKRFHEIKQFYVDCFETFCRFSNLAVALERFIFFGGLLLPKKSGSMTFEEYEALPNGSKPDILKNLPAISGIFIPYIDSKLRNGVGHHSARYIVKSDTINYVNHGKKGTQEFSMPYIVFCEKLVQLYVQLEIVFLYWAGAYGKSHGIVDKIV
jgi:hypothetical protein